MIIESDVVWKEEIINALKVGDNYTDYLLENIELYVLDRMYIYCSYDFQNKQRLLPKAA